MSFFRTKFSLIMLAGSALLLTSSCKKEQYTPHTLTHMISPQDPKKLVDISVRPLTKIETNSLFDGRGNRLLRKHKEIYPLFLSIRNNSNRTYRIDRKNIGLQLASPAHVAARLYSHTARRIVTSVIIGTIGTAVTLFGGFYLIILGAIPAAGMPVLIKAGYVTLGLSGLIAVGTPTVSYQQGSSAYSYNCALEHDVMAHTLVEPIAIEPQHEFSCLLFVPRRTYRTLFSLQLVDQSSNKSISFDIELPKGGIL